MAKVITDLKKGTYEPEFQVPTARSPPQSGDQTLEIQQHSYIYSHLQTFVATWQHFMMVLLKIGASDF